MEKLKTEVMKREREREREREMSLLVERWALQ